MEGEARDEGPGFYPVPAVVEVFLGHGALRKPIHVIFT